jgi:hypothetical protein
MVIAAAAVALLSAAACIGWLSGRSGSVQLASVAAATPGPSASSAAPRVSSVTAPSDWRVVLDALDRGRAQAFATGDTAHLRAVYAAGSPLLAADRAAIERVRSAGQTARGVRHTIRSATVVSDDGRIAVLRTIDVLAAYDVLDASGRVVQRSPPRAAAAFVVTLVRTGAGWRLQQVTRV